MTLGEQIKTYRQKAGMSQEKVAELVGVSRQAVTKWEMNRSSPNTENLFRLAEIFSISVEQLLSSEDNPSLSPVEQLYQLIKAEEAERAAKLRKQRRDNLLFALAVAGVYLLLYLIGRLIWCDMRETTLMGWLFLAQPKGAHSYLYGWLLHNHLFWYAMLISALPSFWGKYRFSCTALLGFIAGLAAGMIFGPYPEGAATGHTHYGWAIWGGVFLCSVIAGIIVQKRKTPHKKRAEA